jgi:hypothetical protein
MVENYNARKDLDYTLPVIASVSWKLLEHPSVKDTKT